jgi:hypothetical protein
MLFGELTTDVPQNQEGAIIKDFMVKSSFERPAKYRYVKVIAEPAFHEIPSWHLGAGGQPWLFADEVIIR